MNPGIKLLINNPHSPGQWLWPDAQELLAKLSKLYIIIDSQAEAQRELEALYQKDSPFNNFVTKLVRLADRAGYGDIQKIILLRQKISNNLQDLLVTVTPAGRPKAGSDSEFNDWVELLQGLSSNLDITKCEFHVTETKYLGLIVSTNGIRMDPEKVKTVLNWPAPKCLRDLQRFIGFANFYRRFIKGFSRIAGPLTTLMKKDQAWQWTGPAEETFALLKHAFTSAPILAFYDPGRKTTLETDASDWASGGLLSQYQEDGTLRPVAYFSAKHSAAECNYEIYDKELLAIIKSLEEWRPELAGSEEPFEVLTDHKNLEYFMTTKQLNPRQARWAQFLSDFNFQIKYRPGTKATQPDALSRLPGDKPADASDERLAKRRKTLLPAQKLDPKITAELGLQLHALDTSQPIDNLIDDAYQTNKNAVQMTTALQNPKTRKWPKEIRRDLRIAMSECDVIEGRIYHRNRLFIPDSPGLRLQILHRTHSSPISGHPGRVKTLDLLTRTYWWPNISRDTAAFVKGCALCTRTKKSRLAPPGYLRPLPIPFRPWSDISIDHVVNLPICERRGIKYSHILVVICRLTKMRHYLATDSLEATAVADAFVKDIYRLHGAPDTVVSDRGTSFVSAFIRALSQRIGTTLKPSSAFHPATNGQTEAANAWMEQYLRAFICFHQDDWADWLPLAEFAANNQISESTGISPFFANYGFNPRLGIEPAKPASPTMTKTQKQEALNANTLAERMKRILEVARALMKEAKERYERQANEHRSEAPRYHEGDLVWLSSVHIKTQRPSPKLSDTWLGPYKVLKAYSQTCVLELDDNSRLSKMFHTSLLRPYQTGIAGQDEINKEHSRRNKGLVLSRDDDGEEIEEWQFDRILDSRTKNNQLEYHVRWTHNKPTWQPADDLKGCTSDIDAFHRLHPDKPGPPSWHTGEQQPKKRRGRPPKNKQQGQKPRGRPPKTTAQ